MAKGESRGNKRKFGGRGSSHYGPTPRRGPPALFVTCESGREKKCQREALELIHHYYYGSKHTTTDAESKGTSEDIKKPSPSTKIEEDDKPLSLQDELAMLRKGAVAEEVLNSKRPRHGSTNGIATSKQVSTMKSPFSIYDSGMRGMVCILCTLPNCEMVPYDKILAELKAAKEKDNATVTNNVNGNEKSSVKQTTEASKETKVNEVKWDPVHTVRCILRDAKIINKKSDEKDNDSKQKDICQAEDDQKEAAALLASSPPPGSRYISRILPMQATCFASVEEIKAVTTSLLKQILPKSQILKSKEDKEIAFKVEIKLRLCSHLKRDNVIEAVAPIVMSGGLKDDMPGYKFSVNLSNPDFSIRVETCKSLCGVSIVPREAWCNFNLAEITNPTEEEEDDKKKD